MKPTKVGDTWAIFDDDTCWAIPDNPTYESSLEWFQRHGSEGAIFQQRFCVAQALSCYRALIDLPQRERSRRVRAIREAVAMRDWAKQGGERG